MNSASDKANDKDAPFDVPNRARMPKAWRRMLPLSALALILATVLALDLGRFMTLDALRENRALLLQWVESNYYLTLSIFILAYAGATAVSVPGASVLTMLGGFLFGHAGDEAALRIPKARTATSTRATFSCWPNAPGSISSPLQITTGIRTIRRSPARRLVVAADVTRLAAADSGPAKISGDRRKRSLHA